MLLRGALGKGSVEKENYEMFQYREKKNEFFAVLLNHYIKHKSEITDAVISDVRLNFSEEDEEGRFRFSIWFLLDGSTKGIFCIDAPASRRGFYESLDEEDFLTALRLYFQPKSIDNKDLDKVSSLLVVD